MIKILFISSFKLPRIYSLKKHLADLGIEIIVVDISGKRNAVNIIREITKYPKDVVLMTHENLLVPFCFLLMSFCGYNYILIQNGVLWNSWKSESKLIQFARHGIFKWILRRAEHVITNSNYLKKQLTNYLPVLREKIVCIHNAVEYPEPAVEFFEFAKNKINLVTITNFEHPLKFEGVFLLAEALNKINNDKISFNILGKVLNPSGEDNLKHFIERIGDLNLNFEISIHKNVQVSKFFPHDAKFVYFSLPGGDSFPRAVLEVISLGVQSLLVDTNGVSEVISSADLAEVVPMDQEKVIEGIKRLISSGVKDESERRSQTDTLKKEFSWENMANKYAELLSKR